MKRTFLLSFSLLLLCAVGISAEDVGALPKYSSSNENQIPIRISSVSKDLDGVDIGTIATVWTPASGKKFRLMGGTISVSAAGNVLFEDHTAGNFVFRTPKLAADTPYNFVVRGGQGVATSTANHVLKATLSTAGTITGTLYGTEE